MTHVIVVGAGISGLTLALQLHRIGVDCVVYEAVSELAPIGVGINILPHASKELARLDLLDDLADLAVTTRDGRFYNRFGQHIYTEPVGRQAGYDWPQFSVHRGDLQQLLARVVRDRLGPQAIVTGHRCASLEQNEKEVTVHFDRPDWTTKADAVVACDGIHSVVRRQLHPDEGAARYSGYMMWRGVTAWPRILSGASMIRVGWLATGKLVVYPIRDRVDSAGRQLVNWVAEIEAPCRGDRDWNRAGRVEDFIDAFADWHFDWLDVPAFIRAADLVLEYPMVDQDPLERWGEGRVTLLGDAAHPMLPRGSNGAGQAIVDTRVLADALAEHRDPRAAFAEYEATRRPATAAVVRANRTHPPDIILREIYERTGDRPFTHIEDVISTAELSALVRPYRQLTGEAAVASQENRWAREVGGS